MKNLNKSEQISDIKKQLLSHQENEFDHDQINQGKSQKIQIYYHVRIQVNIKAKNQTKTILNEQEGLIQAATFTAILGPSGSGKTTLLNFLAGRLVAENMNVQGQLRFNSQRINSLDPYSNMIGYVMQEDSLLGTLTVRQCFLFACKIRLNLSEYDAHNLVNNLLSQLGLNSCADVKVGNSFLKGISGGQRKRTSIGVELITNPSIIYLDEPTTGLDSTTALQVIRLCKNLAKQGKTVISVIHQPSSEIYNEFDKLLLLVDGRCIYQGSASQANEHFQAQGFKCPQLMNASQFYLDMMSPTEAEDFIGQQYEEAIKLHHQKILRFKNFYLQSKHHKFVEKISEPVQMKPRTDLSAYKELSLIAKRALICQTRNPMDVGFKIIQSIFTALIVLLVYGRINNDTQNVRGVIFFIVSSQAFAGIQGTLATFASERPVFLRQRFSKSYKTYTYFIARTGVNIPFEIIYATFTVTIVYWGTGLGDQTFSQYIELALISICTYFCAASYGLLYASLIPKLQIAMALVPVLIIPFMLLGGFFVNLNNIHDARVVFYPIMYLSPFKYGYQGSMSAIKIQSAIDQNRSPDGVWENLFILVGIALFWRLIAIICMQLVSNPKRPQLKEMKELSFIGETQPVK